MMEHVYREIWGFISFFGHPAVGLEVNCRCCFFIFHGTNLSALNATYHEAKTPKNTGKKH